MGAWLATCFVAVLAIVGCWSRGLNIAVNGTGIADAAGALAIWLGFVIYCQRRLPRFVAPLHASVQTFIFSASIAILQYAAADPGRPLADAAMLAFDRHLWLDWRAYFDFVDSHAAIAKTMEWVYNALFAQLPAVIFVVGFCDPERLRRFVAANMIGLATTLGMATIWPVAGAFVTSGIDYSFNPYPIDFSAARAGAIHVLHLGNLSGIVQFPSYHAELATFVVYATARLRPWIAWPVGLLEAAIVLAAPVYGGHYFADILGGLAVALISIAAAEVAYRYAPRGPHRDLDRALVGAEMTRWTLGTGGWIARSPILRNGANNRVGF
jgi:hypothetical protein